MDRAWMWGIASVVSLAAGGASAEPRIEIKNAAARVVVIPEARSDVKVQFISTNAALPLVVRQSGERVVVEGQLRHRISGCRAEFGKITVRIRGLGEVSYDNLPQLVARVPKNARVDAWGAVFGSVARSDSLELSVAGCGNWTLANVKGQLKINQAGSGDTRSGAAGELIAHVAGSGDIMVKDVAGGATVDIAGSGDVAVASINGPLRANIAGSGDVRVERGHASEVVANVAGSGDVRFGGVADSLKAAVAGSGGVSVAEVTGQVRKSILGSGDVTIGR
jgi:hypothetical protein